MYLFITAYIDQMLLIFEKLIVQKYTILLSLSCLDSRMSFSHIPFLNQSVQYDNDHILLIPLQCLDDGGVTETVMSQYLGDGGVTEW